jgi:hypothetical protein
MGGPASYLRCNLLDVDAEQYSALGIQAEPFEHVRRQTSGVVHGSSAEAFFF